jgi:hypothetical protein
MERMIIGNVGMLWRWTVEPLQLPFFYQAQIGVQMSGRGKFCGFKNYHDGQKRQYDHGG